MIKMKKNKREKCMTDNWGCEKCEMNERTNERTINENPNFFSALP